MRIGIFYFSLKVGDGRWPIFTNCGRALAGYVRAEEVDAPNLSAALEMAMLRDDETLMNTHALDAADWDRVIAESAK